MTMVSEEGWVEVVPIGIGHDGQSVWIRCSNKPLRPTGPIVRRWAEQRELRMWPESQMVCSQFCGRILNSLGPLSML